MESNVLYTSHCPKCKVLEAKLKQKNVQYVECDDVQVMIGKGIKSAPQLEVNGVMMDFVAAVKYVNGL